MFFLNKLFLPKFSNGNSYICTFKFLMRKIAVLFIVCMCGLFCFGQGEVNLNGYNIFYYPNGNKSGEGYLVDGKPDGWWKSYSEKGTLISEGNRKNTLLDSLWVFYNDLGDTTLTIYYSGGKKNGTRTQYFTDERIVENWSYDSLVSPILAYDKIGYLRRTTPCVDGKPHGIEKQFDTAGKIIMIAYYHSGILAKREAINRSDYLGRKQGNWKYFWDNGNLRMEGTYLNDKKHGFFKQYDVNGNFLSVQKYENDVLIEDAKETKQLTRKIAYHSNGQPSIIATYFNDAPEGIRREFDADGNLIKGYVFRDGILTDEGITDMNGKRQGKWKEFYETGELRAEGNYKNSVKVGDWQFFFQDKSIEVVGSYNTKGEKTGEWQWYYPNQQVMMTENYDDGVLDGEYWEYDENGEIITQGNYVEGEPDGTWIYHRGTAIEEGNYYDGMRTGLWKTWWEKDKISSEIEFDHDLMNGKYTIYYDNNVIKRAGKYINGERDGIWYDYYDTGELFLTTLYKDGNEVKWNNYKIED